MAYVNVFLKKGVLIYGKGRVTERERALFQSLVDSPDGHNEGDWSRARPGAPAWSTHVAGRGPDTWTSFCCFPEHISSELDEKWSNRDLNPHSDWCWPLCHSSRNSVLSIPDRLYEIQVLWGHFLALAGWKDIKENNLLLENSVSDGI